MPAHAKPPLGGVTVVSLEQAVAAPFATRQLADLGARVIKVERPDGGDFARAYDTTVNGLSSHFVWLNRSKESLTLDLKQAVAAAALRRLLDRADIFVQNLAPGAAERLDLGSAALRQRHPTLIVCNISGYGTEGPYAKKKAYDLLVQSEVGLTSITGTAESPCRVGISIADIAAGMYAYSGVLAALLARGATGVGTTVEVSLFDALAEWMSFPVYHTAYGGAALPRSGPHHSSIAPYGPFRCAAGVQVFLAVQRAREWVRFCAGVLEQPGLADAASFRTNELRMVNRDALHRVIDQVLSALPVETVIDRLEAAGIAYARMNSVAELIEHPQLSTRDRWHGVDSESGPVRMLKPPVLMEGITSVMGAVPALGEHTEAILEELGFDRATIDTWKQDRVI